MKKALLILSFLFADCDTYAQNSKKESLHFYKSITKLDTSEIKQGNHLASARTFTIEEFVVYYIKQEKYQDTKDMGWLLITALYKDSSNTYFVRKNTFGIIDFFKVNTKDLNESDYEELDGKILREKFIAEIVPESDKEKVAKKSGNHMMMFENPKFTYTYNRYLKRILINYRWKLNGDFGIKVFNRTYNAVYEIATKEFIK